MKFRLVKICNRLTSVVVLSAVGVSVVNAAAPDFTALVAAVDTTTLLTAIAAVAAIKMAPGATKWAFSKLIGWFR